MALLEIPIEVLPATRALRAQADVIEVDEGRGFCASVLVMPGSPPVARLDRSINGASYEGAVLRWTMMHTTGLFGWGYFVYRLASESLCCRSGHYLSHGRRVRPSARCVPPAS